MEGNRSVPKALGEREDCRVSDIFVIGLVSLVAAAMGGFHQPRLLDRLYRSPRVRSLEWKVRGKELPVLPSDDPTLGKFCLSQSFVWMLLPFITMLPRKFETAMLYAIVALGWLIGLNLRGRHSGRGAAEATVAKGPSNFVHSSSLKLHEAPVRSASCPGSDCLPLPHLSTLTAAKFICSSHPRWRLSRRFDVLCWGARPPQQWQKATDDGESGPESRIRTACARRACESQRRHEAPGVRGSLGASH